MSNGNINDEQIDAVMQQALQFQLSAYKAKENYDVVTKLYNDQVNNLLATVDQLKITKAELINKVKLQSSRIETLELKIQRLEKSDCLGVIGSSKAPEAK